MKNISCCPAYIMDSRWNIAAWNASASAVFGDFDTIPAHERNVVYMMFCTPQYMRLFIDWEAHAKGIIARFRAAMAKHMDDSWFAEFTDTMKSKSPDFAAWWPVYDVHSMFSVIKEIDHPAAGKLTFEFSSFDVSDNQNLKLILHNPAPGSRDKIKAIMK